jgi:hypothetical protein
MGLFGFLKKSVSDLYIASPPEAAQRLIWLYPDRSIPRGARLTVRSDEAVVFFREGRPVGTLDAGTHIIESAHLPFLGDLVVSPLTGDNHYLTELFFVRRSECIHRTGARPIGTFTDVASRLLVSLGFSARFSLRVTGPLALITSLGGQNAGSAEQVAEFVDARLTSLVAAYVGRLVASEPITQVVSNQYSEELGRAVLQTTRAAFSADGLDITRFLELRIVMDATSEASLREHGRRLADLSLQREGAEIAKDPGFSAFHLAQGQRAMLEGFGKGSAAGHAVVPALLGGAFGFGEGSAGVLLPPSAPPVLSAPEPLRAPEVRARPATGDRWYLRTDRGVEGPYGARQLVLRAAAAGLDDGTAMVREERSSAWQPAEDVDALAAEFGRRATSKGVAHGGSAVQLFEHALAAAAADRVVSRDELDLLAGLALGGGLAPDHGAALDYVVNRARALGCSVAAQALDAPPMPTAAAPPPPPVTTYSYSNGIDQIDGLGAEAIAARIRKAPDGHHVVWRPGMAQWSAAADVADIGRLLP